MHFTFWTLPHRHLEPPVFVCQPARRVCLTALTAVAFALGASTSSGFFEVARGELILNTTAKATFDSNIFARNDGGDDLYFSLVPELQYLRTAGRGTIDVRAGVDVSRFLDFTEEDFEDFFASFEITYPTSPDSQLSGGLAASYTEESRVDEYLNTRVSSEQTAFSLASAYRVSERLGLRNDIGYDHTRVDDFSDTESYHGTIGLQWTYSPHLDWFLDYRLRRSESSGDDPASGQEVDNLDHAVFLGATGVLAPRLTGTVSAGYQQTDARGSGSDQGQIVTAAQLDWDWRPRTDLTLALDRDLDLSPADETVETTGLLLSVHHQVDPKIALQGRIGYRLLDFRGQPDRQDNAVTVGAGLDYLFTQYWNAGLSYDFTTNDSNVARSDFDRHIVQIFTRYSF